MDRAFGRLTRRSHDPLILSVKRSLPLVESHQRSIPQGQAVVPTPAGPLREGSLEPPAHLERMLCLGMGYIIQEQAFWQVYTHRRLNWIRPAARVGPMPSGFVLCGGQPHGGRPAKVAPALRLPRGQWPLFFGLLGAIRGAASGPQRRSVMRVLEQALNIQVDPHQKVRELSGAMRTTLADGQGPGPVRASGHYRTLSTNAPSRTPTTR